MSSVDYSVWTKADLQAEADARNLVYSTSDTKAALVDLLLASDAAGGGAVSETAVDVPPEAPAEAVDMTSIEPPEPTPGEGDEGPIILPGTWVILNETVDDPYKGVLATIVSSPWSPAPIGAPDQPIKGYIFDDEALYVVQTRDENNALLEVDEDAFLKTAQERGLLAR